jgi:hypothetical protein
MRTGAILRSAGNIFNIYYRNVLIYSVIGGIMPHLRIKQERKLGPRISGFGY